MFLRVAGLAAFVWAAGQAGGDAAKSHGGIDVGIASIVCAAIAGIVAIAVALISRPREQHDTLDDEVRLALIASLVAIRGHQANDEGDEVMAEEQRLLGRHLSAELERRTRGKK